MTFYIAVMLRLLQALLKTSSGNIVARLQIRDAWFADFA